MTATTHTQSLHDRLDLHAPEMDHAPELNDEELEAFVEHVLTTRSDMLLAAPALVVFRRYPANGGREAVYQLIAVTGMSIHGNMSSHVVTTAQRRYMDALLLQVSTRRNRLGIDRSIITSWGDMSRTLRQRILLSTILPREMRTMQRMDRLTIEHSNGDFFAVLAGGDTMRMLG